MVTDTSKMAYNTDRARLDSQKEKVFEIVCLARHPSSRDVARLMGVERTSITGRLKELEDEGLIEKAPNKKRDPWTGHEVYWYRPR
jgi:DNA-binding MarR family transcriptional regulator